MGKGYYLHSAVPSDGNPLTRIGADEGSLLEPYEAPYMTAAEVGLKKVVRRNRNHSRTQFAATDPDGATASRSKLHHS